MQAARHPDNSESVCVRLFLLQIALKWFVDVHDQDLEKKKDTARKPRQLDAYAIVVRI